MSGRKEFGSKGVQLTGINTSWKSLQSRKTLECSQFLQNEGYTSNVPRDIKYKIMLHYSPCRASFSIFALRNHCLKLYCSQLAAFCSPFTVTFHYKGNRKSLDGIMQCDRKLLLIKMGGLLTLCLFCKAFPVRKTLKMLAPESLCADWT